MSFKRLIMAIKARFRIYELIEMGINEVKKGNVERGRDYVKLAIEYAKKGSIKIPREYKRKYCRNCFVPLVIGITESRRVKSKILIRRCLECNWIRRYELRGLSKESEGISLNAKDRQKRSK